MKQRKKVLEQILLKLANGFTYTETIEEYVPQKDEQDYGELTLAKKKVTTHYIPPDMLAIKMLLENDRQKVSNLSSMTDEELIALKDKLIKEFVRGENL